jgi:hypothetical protein
MRAATKGNAPRVTTMSRKGKGRTRLVSGATPKTTDTENYSRDPLAGWFSLAKSSRIQRQQKRGWQRGR